MSAIAALKGYRTQFLYSLYYILSNLGNNFIYRLEGEEDLDILDSNGQLLYAIQLKNLSKTITLSDLLSENNTSFIRRFIDKYADARPILVSYGEISKDLKKWSETKDIISDKEKTTLKKYGLTVENWKLVKAKTQFIEIKEDFIIEEVERIMKDNFSLIDPIPTIGFILNWLQTIAEQQQPITTKDFYIKIEDFAKYIVERIAIYEQYGIVLNPLHKVSTKNVNQELLEKEFYNATLTRYEHILLGLDVKRENYLEQINTELKSIGTLIVKGASGQGKTALLYSYVHNYANDLMIFELNIQQEIIKTLKSIQAIASISKSLDVPTIFIINVQPNTTEWLKIVKMTSHLKHIKFLVSVRNEDWYRATAVGIEFEHKELDLNLSKDEAEIIYESLNDRNKIIHYTDFEEAWIKVGNNIPLLEFVYSITQGSSLRNKLNQQVQQILKEEGIINNPQIDFLRIVSLADSLGAKIDISKLDSNVDYHFIIEKLEKEYLLRKSTNRKYIEGLHIVRSKTLVNILFDTNTSQKEYYALKCISLIAEEDLYIFILQAFHLEMLSPTNLIDQLNKLSDINWSIYSALIKAFIWIGIKEYVENNRTVINECFQQFGDAWYMMLDLMFFYTNFNRNSLLDLFQLSEEKREEIEALNSQLTSNKDIFKKTETLINRIIFPQKKPTTVFEWKSFGEVLFWLKNIPNQKEAIPTFPESEFELTFKDLDSQSLSKLMLGMHFYSDELNSIRKEYAHHFVNRIKQEYDVIHIVIDDKEIYVHYIIDILNNDNKRTSNDFVVNILTLLRTAFPDKEKYHSQGYGHKIQILSSDVDNTHKSISIESMPLEEWTSINSCIIKLFEYTHRPSDWIEYCKELNQWEQIIDEKIRQFNSSFIQLFKGSETYKPITPVLTNIIFKQTNKIKEPMSITDPLGIYSNKKKNDNTSTNTENIGINLQLKYEPLFKSLSEFKNGIENFILQSAQTLASRIKLQSDKNHLHNDNIERISQTNLYSSIENLTEFNNQYKNNFSNIDLKHNSKIEFNQLLLTATLWKDFLTNNPKGQHSTNRILKLKADFEDRVFREFKKASKANSFLLKYINNEKTDNKPVVVIESKSTTISAFGMKEAYNIIQTVINNPEHTSLKYLMLQVWFSNFYFIQTIYNRSINNQWVEVKLYTLKDILFEELSINNLISSAVNKHILDNLKIENWGELFPAFNEILKTSESYGKMLILVEHFYDLRFFDDVELTKLDQEKLKKHVDKIGSEIKQSFQSVLDSLFAWIEMFPFDENAYIQSQEEQEYFTAMMNIKNNIFPEPKGNEVDYQLILNMKIIEGWRERLKVCTSNWFIFTLLLQGKYINKYSQNNII